MSKPVKLSFSDAIALFLYSCFIFGCGCSVGIIIGRYMKLEAAEYGRPAVITLGQKHNDK